MEDIKNTDYMKKYNRAKDDARRIFNAIEDERRNGLLNDLIHENGFYEVKFDDLMKVLEKASVEHKKIAYMLLGVKDKSLVARMIDRISIKHGDKYVVDILMSIDDDGLRSMISNLKDKPVLIARILGGADEVSKLRRLLNIIVLDGISNENMERVLGKLVINARIVNELIDKPEEEQNEMLGRINTQPAVVDKIKCAISKEEEARLLQSICSESFRSFFDRCGYVLGNNTHKNLDSSDCAKLKEEEAYLQVLERMIKDIDNSGIKRLTDSDLLKIFNSIDSGDDAQTNELNGVVERRNVIGIFQTISRKVSGVKESMSEMMIGTFRVDGYSTGYLYRFLHMKEGKIEKNVSIYLMKRMLSVASPIVHEIDKALVSCKECVNGSTDKNKSISDQSKSVDEMLVEIMLAQLKEIIFTAVESMCKQLISKDYELSDKEREEIFGEAIRALPYFGGIISNPLISGAQKRIRAILLAAIIVISAYSGTIIQQIQKIEDISKPIPAIEVSEPNIMVENRDLMLQMPSMIPA